MKILRTKRFLDANLDPLGNGSIHLCKHGCRNAYAIAKLNKYGFPENDLEVSALTDVRVFNKFGDICFVLTNVKPDAIHENAKTNSNDLRPGFDDVASESDKQV